MRHGSIARLGLASLLSASTAACNASVYESNDWSEQSESETETDAGFESESSGTGETDTSETTDEGGSPDGFRVVVLADLHVVPPDWQGDDELLAKAEQRLATTREQIAAIDPPPAFAIVLGDLVHDAYASADPSWYLANPNAFTAVADALAEFPIPVYPLFGDHDYGLPDVGKPVSHQIFAQTFARDPYYVVDHAGWRFVFANTQLGPSFEPANLAFDPTLGSFGQVQLDWLADQLDAGKPSVLLMHFPLFQLLADEAPGDPVPDLASLLATHDEIALVLSGHTLQWNSLPANYPAPHVVFGPEYQDSDNFLLIEFAELGAFEILDADKPIWGTANADTWLYQGQPTPLE
ncbi:metallophosphoesterase family protein [Nannocystaceae bacterium ST9]